MSSIHSDPSFLLSPLLYWTESCEWAISILLLILYCGAAFAPIILYSTPKLINASDGLAAFCPWTSSCPPLPRPRLLWWCFERGSRLFWLSHTFRCSGCTQLRATCAIQTGWTAPPQSTFKRGRWGRFLLFKKLSLFLYSSYVPHFFVFQFFWKLLLREKDKRSLARGAGGLHLPSFLPLVTPVLMIWNNSTTHRSVQWIVWNKYWVFLGLDTVDTIHIFLGRLPRHVFVVVISIWWGCLSILRRHENKSVGRRSRYYRYVSIYHRAPIYWWCVLGASQCVSTRRRATCGEP